MAWRGIFRTKRLAVWVVLAATGILIALLATGVLSKHTGGSEATTPTTAPTITTSTSGGQAETASGFGPGDWGTYGGTFDEIRHSPLTQINTSNVGEPRAGRHDRPAPNRPVDPERPAELPDRGRRRHLRDDRRTTTSSRSMAATAR